jgi:hypothetical protein
MIWIIGNVTAVISTLIVSVGLFYFILNLMFGRLSFLNVYVNHSAGIKFKHIVFIITGLVTILSFFEFHLPYKI